MHVLPQKELGMVGLVIDELLLSIVHDCVW